MGRAGGQWETGSVLLTGFAAGMFQTNCYVLARHEGADAVVVDPGQRSAGRLRRLLDQHRLTPSAVLLTHGHLDHIWAAQKVCDDLGIAAHIHGQDRFLLSNPIKGFGPRFGQAVVGAMFSEPKQVVEVDDGDKLELAGFTVTVDHTPGHTRGSVVFRMSADADEGPVDMVFTGDTLFCGSVGRTDLPGGSGRDLLGSIVNKLLVLSDNTVVLPGHGEATTVGAERRGNPFLEGLSA